jgi:predicted nucleic acid-binding protein
VSLVVDASVWVSAADKTDALSVQSRSFLAGVAARGEILVVPALAPVEVACAFARRTRDAGAGRAVADELVRFPLLRIEPLTAHVLREAVERGTAALLRAADAIYLAVGRMTGSRLVTWDAELVERAEGLTPVAWLADG